MQSGYADNIMLLGYSIMVMFLGMYVMAECISTHQSFFWRHLRQRTKRSDIWLSLSVAHRQRLAQLDSTLSTAYKHILSRIT